MLVSAIANSKQTEASVPMTPPVHDDRGRLRRVHNEAIREANGRTPSRCIQEQFAIA